MFSNSIQNLYRRQRDEQERRQRVMVITEFDAGEPEATLHALADEILRYQCCVRQLVDAIELTSAGAEFGLIRRPLSGAWCCSPSSSISLH